MQRVGVLDAAGLAELGHPEATDLVTTGAGDERQRVQVTVLNGH
ncbi:hypothetical protein [Nocardioides pyridinolyticus]